jgi:hypothetical protein
MRSAGERTDECPTALPTLEQARLAARFDGTGDVASLVTGHFYVDRDGSIDENVTERRDPRQSDGRLRSRGAACGPGYDRRQA